MLAKLVRKFRRDTSSNGGVQKNPIAKSLNERVGEVEKTLYAAVEPSAVNANSGFGNLQQLLQAEVKSRERLERKLFKNARKIDQKMDQLSVELQNIKSQLTASNVELDLEKRKNYELRKRITTQPKKTKRLRVN